jgi:hypothetical protein
MPGGGSRLLRLNNPNANSSFQPGAGHAVIVQRLNPRVFWDADVNRAA